MTHLPEHHSPSTVRATRPDEMLDDLRVLPCDSLGGCGRPGVWAITVKAPCCGTRPTTWLACDSHLSTFLARTDRTFRHCGDVFTMREAIVRIDKV